MQKAITINSKEISLLKPITSADYKSKTNSDKELIQSYYC